MTTREGIRIALKTIGYAGLVGTAVAAPNATGAVAALLEKVIPDKPVRQRVYEELRRQKLIEVSKEGTDLRVSITLNGAHRLLTIHADEITIPPMKKWDYRWRLVSYDIPKGKNKERTYFNRRLHELDFTMIQKSMWVHPFECFDEIKAITDYANLTRYMCVMEITKLDERSTKKLLRIYESIIHT